MIRLVRTAVITAGVMDTTATEAAADPEAAVAHAGAARAGEAEHPAIGIITNFNFFYLGIDILNSIYYFIYYEY